MNKCTWQLGDKVVSESTCGTVVGLYRDEYGFDTATIKDEHFLVSAHFDYSKFKIKDLPK